MLLSLVPLNVLKQEACGNLNMKITIFAGHRGGGHSTGAHLHLTKNYNIFLQAFNGEVASDLCVCLGPDEHNRNQIYHETIVKLKME